MKLLTFSALLAACVLSSSACAHKKNEPASTTTVTGDTNTENLPEPEDSTMLEESQSGSETEKD